MTGRTLERTLRFIVQAMALWLLRCFAVRFRELLSVSEALSCCVHPLSLAVLSPPPPAPRQALQRGMFHDLPSLWQTWTTQVALMSLQALQQPFAGLADEVMPAVALSHGLHRHRETTLKTHSLLSSKGVATT